MSVMPGALLALAPGRSANLDDTNDAPPTPSLFLQPGPVAGAESFTVPAQPSPDFIGRLMPVFGGLWFDRVHVIPRIRDLGFLLSDLQFTVEVWNAWFDRARINTARNILGPAGISLVSPPSLPTHFAATQSRIYTVSAQAAGAAFVDNDIVWVFTGEDPAGTTLALVGTRVVPLTIDANMLGGIRERYGFLTDVLVSWDDNEQRRQLKNIPARGVSMSLLTIDARETQLLEALIWGWQDRPYGVPLWFDAQPLGAPIAINDTTIQVVTSDRQFEVDGLLMVWQGPHDWTVFTISAVNPTNIVVSTQATRAYGTAGVVVVPMRLGRLSNQEELQHLTVVHGDMTLDFDVDAWRQ